MSLPGSHCGAATRTDRAFMVVALLVSGQRLCAQDALSLVGPRTEVKSIEFRFDGKQTLEEEELRREIALTERGGMVGIRRFFGFLPFVSDVGVHPFDPVELQRDIIRLENYYRRSGFLKVDARYDVRYDAESDLVEVAYVIREGPPLRVHSLRFVADSGALTSSPKLSAEWNRFIRREQRKADRWGKDELRELADSTTRWLRHRGYPFATADPRAAVDTAADRATVTVLVRPGPRTRIREFEVTGNRRIPARHITRQLPVEPGDWYDADELEKGRQQLVQLDIVRLALLDVPRDRADDSSVVVKVDVTENPPRVVRGEVGLASGGGLAGEVEWTHNAFLGGVRTFTASAAAQTGALSFETPPQQLYRLALTVFQPYLGDRRLSAAAGPFVEYRDDLRDRSRAVGLETSLVYAAGPLRSLTLGYSLSHRRILDYGFGEDLDPIEYLPVLGLAEPDAAGRLGMTRNRSAVSLQGSYGRLDQFANPRRGYVLRPRVEITTPGGFNTSEYLLLDLGGTAFLPLTPTIGFTVRLGAGRIYPFGRSVRTTGEESPFVSLLRLSDVPFTAGGTRDVRGWGSELVGPKLPEVRLETREDVRDTIAERYAPVGGLARILASAEVQLPLPGFSDSWQSFLFFDSGRIWSPDDRFSLNAGELDQDDYYSSVGAGIGYETVVGAVQFAVGYKLNPSPLDLRSPQGVLGALQEGRPLSSVPTESRRRLHLHFSIGSTF
ncbi:MAG TPA: BamA/TamA family outer membrane protein [Gemmatimonadales bacterium]|nr:BamA/TamA family outer membrane protein [Gemmatimonadales bacterium]